MDPLQNAKELPLTSLPYGFKRRLITVAPTKIINNLAKVCPDIEKLCSIRPEAYYQVFITNNEDVYQWASKETFLTVLFKFFYQYALGKYIFDGESNVNPLWQTVLRIDDIVSRKQRIYVEDTLILHCDSIAGYEKMIRYISGSYTRLILHGNINVAQIIRLTHPGVKKVRINANIEIPAGQHTRLANFVAKQTSSNDSSFTIYRHRDIRTQLSAACKRHKRVLIWEDEYMSVVKNYHYLWYRFIAWPLYFAIMPPYVTISLGITFFLVTPDTLLGFCSLYFVMLSMVLLQYSFLHWQFGFNRMDVDNQGMSQDVSFNIFGEMHLVWWLWSVIDSMLLKVYKLIIK